MLILEKLKLKESLTKTEAPIADFLIAQGANLSRYSCRSLAEAVYASPATIVRMCKRLGFQGFDDFKEQYLKEIQYLDSEPGEVDVNFPFSSKDTMMKAANRICQLYQETAADTLSLLHHDTLQRAVKLLRYSQNIYVFSAGTAINQAECFREKMLKIGKRVTISNNLNYQLYEAYCLTPRDVAIIISYSGETNKILRVAAECKKQLTPIIAFTCFGENSLSRYATCKLTISTKESLIHNLGDFSTHLSVGLLLDILYASFFLQDYDENYERKLSRSRTLERLRKSSNSMIQEQDAETPPEA